MNENTTAAGIKQEVMASIAYRSASIVNGRPMHFTVIAEFWSADRYGRHAMTKTTKFDDYDVTYSAQPGSIEDMRSLWNGMVKASKGKYGERIDPKDAGFSPIRRTKKVLREI